MATPHVQEPLSEVVEGHWLVCTDIEDLVIRMRVERRAREQFRDVADVGESAGLGAVAKDLIGSQRTRRAVGADVGADVGTDVGTDVAG